MSESPSHPVPQPSASCPECGGECVPADPKVNLGIFGPPNSGKFYLQRPDAFSRDELALRALTCSRCGLTRLYAEKPAELLSKR
jgi:hypothetical protein